MHGRGESHPANGRVALILEEDAARLRDISSIDARGRWRGTTVGPFRAAVTLGVIVGASFAWIGFAGGCSTSSCAETATCVGSDLSAEEREASAPSTTAVCDSVDPESAFCWDLSERSPDPGPHSFETRIEEDRLSENSTELTTVRFVSAPRSARLVVMRNGERKLSVTSTSVDWNHVRFSFSVFIDEAPADSLWPVARFGFASNGLFDHHFELSTSAQQASFTETWVSLNANLKDEHPLSRPIQQGTWVRVSVELALGSPASFRVLFDGLEVAGGMPGSAGPSAPTGVHASVGITVDSTPLPFVVFFDDILVERIQ